MSIARVFAELIRIVVTVLRPFSDHVLRFIYWVFMGETKKLPPITNKLLLIPAAELAVKIRKRQVSCEEVMAAYIERSKSVHSIINAVTDERYEAALEDARNIDRFLSNGTKSEEDIARDTPLLGLPFSCKEVVGVKGMLQTSGLVRSRDHIAVEDGSGPDMYRKAGAIPVNVTDVPELSMWWESCNHIFGFTRNPYDNTRTPGGSSGGESSLISTGGALFGIGTDLAGSIRMPASFCGIYGHKPSRGIVNNYGTFPFSQMPKKGNSNRRFLYVSTGPMCRYVQDLAPLLRVMSDNDPRLKLNEKVDFKKVSLYYIESFPGFLHKSVPDVKHALQKAVKYFEDQYDIKAIPINFPELEFSFPIWESKLLEDGGPPFKYFLAGGEGHSIHLWWEFFKNLFQRSDHTFPAIYNGLVDRQTKDDFYYFCLKQAKSLEEKFNKILHEDVLILVPTHPEPAPHYLMTIPMYPNIAYTCIFNILGLPGTQIPAGLSKGAPIGVQAISGQFKDHICLAAATELDSVFGGWISPGPISV